MRFYFPIAKVDADARMVWGYASTEAQDDQGEIVKREALAAALAEYMKFANIREMHQLSAVGRAKEAGIDDKGLYVGAQVVDERAWAKVREGVYNGFSIGGRVTERDPADRKIITALTLNEISLVDRPANPEAVFDCWKAEGSDTMAVSVAEPHQPVQIWHCGAHDHRHLAKADAVRCIAKSGAPSDTAAVTVAEEDSDRAPVDRTPDGIVDYADPGYRPDRRKRYPIDTEKHIRAAWAYIHKPANARRYTAAQVEAIKERIVTAWQARIDRDGPPLAARGEKAALAETLRKSLHDVGHAAHILGELGWLRDMLAVEAAMEGDDSPQPARLQAIITELCAFLRALAAEETAELLDGTEVAGLPIPVAAEIVVMAAGNSAAGLADILRKTGKRGLTEFADAVARIGAEHSQADQAMMDHIHACLTTLTDGACCAAEKAGARHSQATRRHLRAAHDHLCRAGAQCASFDAAAEPQGGAAADADKAAHAGDLAKALAEKTVLATALNDILPRLDRLAKRVEAIAATPLPPLTLARGAPPAGIHGVSKREDGGGTAASAEDIVAGLAKMSGEERTMALIKAAHANPMRLSDASAAASPRDPV